jgi:hypothetical protein
MEAYIIDTIDNHLANFPTTQSTKEDLLKIKSLLLSGVSAQDLLSELDQTLELANRELDAALVLMDLENLPLDAGTEGMDTE